MQMTPASGIAPEISGNKTIGEPIEGSQDVSERPDVDVQGLATAYQALGANVAVTAPPFTKTTAALLKGTTDLDRPWLPRTYVSPYYSPRPESSLLSTLNGLPLLQTEYSSLVERVTLLQDEVVQWREYAVQLQKSGALLTASETKAQSDLKMAQADLVKQDLALKSTSAELRRVREESEKAYRCYAQREDQLSTENVRLTTELTASRAEVEKFKMECQQIKAYATTQADVLLAREKDLAIRRDEQTKLLADFNQLQVRSDLSESELSKACSTLKQTKEQLSMTNSEFQKLQLALGETSAREMSLQNKLTKTEYECQALASESRAWMMHTKVQKEAEEARLRSAVYLPTYPSLRSPSPRDPTTYSVATDPYLSFTRARLEEARALERLHEVNRSEILKPLK